MANESDNPQPTTPPAATPSEKPSDKPAVKTDRPSEKRPFKRGDGGPRRDRDRALVRSLDSEMQYHQKASPNVRDLDAEIAAELEAALQGMDDKKLYGADDSKRAREQADAQGDGGRKKGMR